MTEKPAQFRFAREKPGLPGDETWAITHDSISEPTACEVSIRVHYVSVDPGMKGWITNARSYIDAVQPGDVMRGFGVAEVTASAHENFAVGDFCTGFTGIQTHATVTPVKLRKIDPKSCAVVAISGWARYDRFHRLFRLAGHWATKGRRHRRGVISGRSGWPHSGANRQTEGLPCGGYRGRPRKV